MTAEDLRAEAPADLAAARRALLQARVRAARSRASDPLPDVQVRPRAGSGPAPLSACQRQLWYLHQLAPASTAYNEHITLRRSGPLDAAALTAALTEFVARHQAWRTTFEVVDGQGRQVVHDPAPVAVPVFDLSHLDTAAARARAAQLAAEDVVRPYDLATGPLLRPRLVHLPADEHHLQLALHHLVFDGVTLYRVLLPEIVALYDDAVAGRPWSLAPPAVQYPDYSAWELEQLDGPDTARRLAWWERSLAGLRPLDLPLDHARPPVRRFAGGKVALTIDAATTARLKEVAARCGATLFQVLAALHAWWLGLYATGDDVAFATPVDLRRRPELAGMAGYCLTPVVVRADVSGTPTTTDLVTRLREPLIGGMENAVPFEVLVRHLGVPRSASVNPLVQTSFVLEPPAADPGDDRWSLHLVDPGAGRAHDSAKFDLSMALDERPDGHLDGHLIHDADLFEPATAEAMAAVWIELVALAAAAPDAPLADLDLTGATGAAAVHGGTALHDADVLVPDAVRAQAERTPDAVAVVVGERQLTHAQLQAAADRAASRLRRAGARPGVLVAVAVDRSVDLVAGLLGVLAARAAYLPLSPADPPARLRALVEDAGAAVVLTDRASAARVATLGRPVVVLEDEDEDEDGPGPAAGPGAAADDPAYVIYTSGSTGRPKGVVVEHRNLANLVAGFYPVLGVSGEDTVVGVAAATFDMFVGDVFASLAAGARLVLATRDEAADPHALADLLERAGATAMCATPTTWSALVHAGWRGHPGFLAYTGGEPLPEALAEQLAERTRTVVNGYGPTETTKVAALGPVVPGDVITVGRPLPGVAVQVCDAAGRVLPVGVPGEVVIGGAGVARGYLDRPRETELSFVPDPGAPGRRRYRAGDRGRLLPDGRLQVLGRLDDQLKVRGVRIEPGEVEAALMAHPGISAAAVTARGEQGERRLVACVVAAPGPSAPSDVELRAFLRARLPEHLVPSGVVRLSALPQTTSGKVDRAALPDVPCASSAASAPAGETAEEAAPAVAARAPRTATEQHLTRMWGERLGTPVLDAEADFFDLGGYSLMAAELVGAVRERWRIELPLATFLDRGTTVAGLAALVDAAAGGAGVPAPTDGGIDGTRGGPASGALFLAFPDHVASVSMRHLTRAWGAEQRVVPLVPPTVGGRFDRGLGLEGIAAALLRRIRAEQPAGPYALAGFSFGGALVYEVARVLQATGEQVEWLGVFDAASPPAAARVLTATAGVRLARQRARSRPEQARKLLELAARQVLRALVVARLRPRPLAEFDYFGALRLVAGYRHPGHAVPLHLFTSAQGVADSGSATLGWADYHGGPLSVRHFPGDHAAMLRPPQVDELARHVLDGLRQARAHRPR